MLPTFRMSEHKISSLYDNSPDSLLNLCLEHIVNNLKLYTKKDASEDYWVFGDDIVLPAEICENFLRVYQKKYRVDDEFATLFRSRTRLDIVRLRNPELSKDSLRWLLEHKPRTLELQCDYLPEAWLDLINRNSENLVSLKLGPVNNDAMLRYCFCINAPKLRQLSIRYQGSGIPTVLLSRNMRCLTHLELLDFISTRQRPWPRCGLKNLKSLVLHNVVRLVDVIEWIISLHSLQHLDISQTSDGEGKYLNANDFLAKLVTNLPNLESLDISGTNLAGTGSAVSNPEEGTSSTHARCDIPGLVSRVNNPLEFLGLYGTHHGACKRHDIPAKVITGDANEEQIFNACMAYMERPVVLTRVLNDLYYMFRSTEKYNSYVSLTLYIVLNAMERYLFQKHIQISGSAILFYIVKGKEKSRFGIKLKKRIITVLLDGMQAHHDDDTLLRNCCLTLCQFKIPTDVLFEYERVVQILLNGVANVNQEGFVQRLAIYLLNSLACQVDGKQKRFLGNHGAIAKMLNLISDRLEKRICDDVLEVAWSTMWNVTDETPQNSQRFLDNRGMEYFLDCLRNFPDKDELLRNMMGLLGNVAEVASLRPKLMDKLFLTVFYDLLDSSSDGIEISYNAAGVLAHMVSDGPEAWTVEEPSRDDVLEGIATAVERWDRGAERNINYRSFEPILTLLHTYHTPQCQHWAVWALANLTTVYPDKYCSLVEAEGGLQLLYEVLHHPTPYPMIKDLALIVINNCSNYRDETQTPPPGSPDN